MVFVPAPSAMFHFSTLVILLQNGARVFAQPVSSMVLRVKGADIDGITVVTCKACPSNSPVFPINAFPGKAV